MSLNNDRGLRALRPGGIILIQDTQLLQMNLHLLRSHKGEERIHRFVVEMVWQGTKEEASKSAPKAMSFGVALTVGETPACQISWRIVESEVSVTPSEGDGVGENGAADGVTWAKPRAFHHRLG